MKNKNSIKEHYRKSWKFIGESQNFIYAAIIVFFTFFLVGFLLPVPESISEKIIEFLEKLLEETQDMSQSQLTQFIFLNNLKSSFFAMIFGVLLGIFPIFIMVINGYLVGIVSAMSVSVDGLLSLWKLFPHGIFELPAVFLAAGLGLKLGSFIFQKKKIKSLKEYSLNSLRVFVLVITPLLVIAALIEGALIFFGR